MSVVLNQLPFRSKFLSTHVASLQIIVASRHRWMQPFFQARQHSRIQNERQCGNLRVNAVAVDILHLPGSACSMRNPQVGLPDYLYDA